jgi:hypothetical protein
VEVAGNDWVVRRSIHSAGDGTMSSVAGPSATLLKVLKVGVVTALALFAL